MGKLTIAQIKKLCDSAQSQGLDEEILFFLQSDSNRANLEYHVKDLDGDGIILHLTPESLTSTKYEALIPGTVIRCHRLKILGGELFADSNSHILAAPKHSLTDGEKKIFSEFKPEPARRIKIEEVLAMKKNQLVTEDLVVKVKKKILESSQYGTNKYGKIKLLDSSGRITFLVYQQNDTGGASIVSTFEEDGWYKMRNVIVDVSGPEVFLKNNRGISTIEKLSPSEVKKQTTIPATLEKGDFTFFGKIIALDRPSFIQMCSYCPKAAMYCKVHEHDPKHDRQNYSLMLIAYETSTGNKHEFKAVQEKLVKHSDGAVVFDEETLLKAYEKIVGKQVRIFYNKTYNFVTGEVRDYLFEDIELLPDAETPAKAKKTKSKPQQPIDDNEDPEAKKAKK